MTLLLDRLELGRVELLVEIGLPFVGNPVEAAVNTVQKPVLRELGAPLTGVLPRRAAEVVDRLRRQVAVLTNELQDPVIGRSHPLRILTHIISRCTGCTHMDTDMRHFTTNSNETTANRRPSLNNRHQHL